MIQAADISAFFALASFRGPDIALVFMLPFTNQFFHVLFLLMDPPEKGLAAYAANDSIMGVKGLVRLGPFPTNLAFFPWIHALQN